jgi:hypothetical protein
MEVLRTALPSIRCVVASLVSFRLFTRRVPEGPIVKVTLAGDDFVVLSDPADAEELVNIQ